MSGPIAPWRGAGRSHGATGADQLEAADLGWILLLPAVCIAALGIALLASPAGRIAFPDPGYHYWLPAGPRKSSVQAGYLMFILAVIAYVAAIVKLDALQLRVSPRARRLLVAGAQVLCAAFVAACWVAQWRLRTSGATRVYFTPATLIVALGVVVSWGLVVHSRDGGVRSRLADVRTLRWDSRAVGWACFAVALLATLIWLLPAIHTDHRPPSGTSYLDALFFDESTAVLNGRSPLVNMVAYGSLWPYVAAIPLGLFGGAYAAFAVTMAALAGLSLLAVYDVLRRVAGRAVLALVLYLPVLATGFFLEQRTGPERYDPGTYFGMFPLRYAGPYLLAWLTARHVQRQPASRWSRRLLFAAGGLVALNNVDFGTSALAATTLAVLVAERTRDRRALGRLAVDLGAGLAAALAVVSTVTLARAGALPHMGLLLRYGRVFVDGGYSNLPVPVLGLHLVVSATFVAAGAVAAVRTARSEEADLLAAMLAWCATFGLGASIYYYAYRSHPDVLISLFSIWSLTLALLVVAVLKAPPRPRRWLGVPSAAVVFAFALAACSIAQMPTPWAQLRRIREAPTAQELVPSGAFRQAAVVRRVAEQTNAGERVVILSPMGHRVARDAHVVNVSAYPGLEQMPAREQLDETVATLRREGGSKVFLAEPTRPGLDAELRRRGFDLVHRWQVDAWPETNLLEYRAA